MGNQPVLHKPLTKDDVLDIVTTVLQRILDKHQAGGRHELNRTDTETVLQELFLKGLPSK
jgi:hypothetical protein